MSFALCDHGSLIMVSGQSGSNPKGADIENSYTEYIIRFCGNKCLWPGPY